MITEERMRKLAIMRANPQQDFIDCRVCGQLVPVSEKWSLSVCPDCYQNHPDAVQAVFQAEIDNYRESN